MWLFQLKMVLSGRKTVGRQTIVISWMKPEYCEWLLLREQLEPREQRKNNLEEEYWKYLIPKNID